jgi:hypothetical protein
LAAKASTVAIMLYSSLRPTLQLQRGRWRKKTGVELWNWSEFQKRISSVYLNGKSYQEFSAKPLSGERSSSSIML